MHLYTLCMYMKWYVQYSKYCSYHQIKFWIITVNWTGLRSTYARTPSIGNTLEMITIQVQDAIVHSTLTLNLIMLCCTDFCNHCLFAWDLWVNSHNQNCSTCMFFQAHFTWQCILFNLTYYVSCYAWTNIPHANRGTSKRIVYLNKGYMLWFGEMSVEGWKKVYNQKFKTYYVIV